MCILTKYSKKRHKRKLVDELIYRFIQRPQITVSIDFCIQRLSHCYHGPRISVAYFYGRVFFLLFIHIWRAYYIFLMVYVSFVFDTITIVFVHQAPTIQSSLVSNRLMKFWADTDRQKERKNGEIQEVKSKACV